MKKHLNRSTPISILLNIVLIINVIIVLYPVLFTISSSFTLTNSLGATSVIPFTEEEDKYVKYPCNECDGTGNAYQTITVSSKDADGKRKVIKGKKLIDCSYCKGTGERGKLVAKFSLKKPSLWQYRRLLADPDEMVEHRTMVGGEEVVVTSHGTNYKTWYLNTLKIACMNTLLTVIICTTAGYIFSRFNFLGRKQIMAGMIVLQMFPSFIGMVATYVILWKFNALNTLWGLVLVYAAGSIPFNSQLMKGYFDTMPKDIAEAAYIDGASPLVAYIRVILPAAKPQIVFLTLTSFTGPWMDYIFPRMVLRSDDKKTLAVGLYEMISGRSNDNFTMFAAGAILVAVPFAILFVAGQKSLLQSLAGTSGKE